MKRLFIVAITAIISFSSARAQDSSQKTAIDDLKQQVSSLSAKMNSFQPAIKKIDGKVAKIKKGLEINLGKSIDSQITDFTTSAKRSLDSTVKKVDSRLAAFDSAASTRKQIQADIKAIDEKVDGKADKDLVLWTIVGCAVTLVIAIIIGIKANKRSKVEVGL